DGCGLGPARPKGSLRIVIPNAAKPSSCRPPRGAAPCTRYLALAPVREMNVRSPAGMDIVQIDISTKCHLKCSNCTRLIAHQPNREDMPVEKFERAVKSMQGWQAPGNILGVIAGEPTLHSEFEQISMRFAELWGGPLTGNGKFPIADFNDIAVQRL